MCWSEGHKSPEVFHKLVWPVWRLTVHHSYSMAVRYSQIVRPDDFDSHTAQIARLSWIGQSVLQGVH